jgi:ABC-2 type transport system permease protein
MFFKLATFEFIYSCRQRSFFIALLIFFAMPFIATVSMGLQMAGHVHINSPYNITDQILMMSMLGIFMAAVFVGDTATRDTLFRMDGFVLSSQVKKFDLLWGRLLGSYGFCLATFAVVPLAILLGTLWPGIDAEVLGETRLMPYVWSFVVFVIPNFLFSSVIFYILALRLRSMMGVYLGAVAFFVLYELSSDLLNVLDLRYLSVLLDPFGISAFNETTQYWTAAQRNSQVVSMQGSVLSNRLFWLFVSVALMVANQYYFDIRQPAKLKPTRKLKESEPIAPSGGLDYRTTVAQLTSFTAERKRFITRTKFEMARVVKSIPFLVLCFLPLLSLLSVEISGANGVVGWPLTREMVDRIGNVFFPTLLIIITYYGAEIVWHEQQLGIADIIDATATRNLSLYFPKIIALCLVVSSLMLISVVLTVFNQIVAGYYNFDPSLYFSLLLIKTLLPMLMMIILAVSIQIFSPNKYLGMLIFVIIWMVLGGVAQLGLVHNMWLFASIPVFEYSDLNGYGHFMSTVVWYNLYWFGLILLLLVMGFGLWRRGSEYDIKYRFGLLRSHIGKWGERWALGGLTLFVGAGGYIYYNTIILNEYPGFDDNFNFRESYERKYKTFASDDIPTIESVAVDIDFFPQQRKVTVKGQYQIENGNDKPVHKSIVQWDSSKHNRSLITLENG